MTEHGDVEHDELGRRVRASLDAHAGEVDTSVPVAARARSAARKHRGRRVAVGVAVAVAAVAVTAVVVERSDPPSSGEPPVATDLPSQWRTEYWHDISVQVPADWGWGAGPFNKSMARCGGPLDPSTPYVGRPIALSDACGIQKPPTPTAAYLWFDAPVEPGTFDLPNGYVQETVVVDADGTTVTVGSGDRALRERILASVARQDLCPASADASGLDRDYSDRLGELQSAELCAYSRPSEGGGLVYARELDRETLSRFERALDGAPEAGRLCKGSGDLVVVTASSDDRYGDQPISRTWISDLACATVSSARGVKELTTDVEDSWADEGVRTSLQSYGAWG
jgi:hypothetical protein